LTTTRERNRMAREIHDTLAQPGTPTSSPDVQRVAPAVNITTIYRTLDLLEGLDLVRHTHLGHGAPSYSTNAHEHIHLVCHRCGDVTEVPPEELTDLTERLRERFGFVLDPSHLALSGRCRGCAEHGEAAAEANGS